MVALLVGDGACAASLPRLEREGRHEEVTQRASAARSLPRRRAARAWARSLVALGDEEQARAVLLADFRHGGQLASLVALADLEASRGRDGIAAAHYSRALSIDHRILSGHGVACGLFRARARAFARQDEPQAAHRDLERAAAVCAGVRDELARVEDRELAGNLAPLAAARARARRALEREPDAPAARLSEREAAIDARIDEARRAGAPALLRLAREDGLSLAPPELLMLLVAEYRGELGPRLVGDHLLRQLVGDTASERLFAATAALDEGARAYAYLRLSRVIAVPESEGDVARWSTAALRGFAGTEGTWRVMAAGGDLAGAELAVASHLRTRLERAEEEAAAAASAGEAASAGGNAGRSRSRGPRGAGAGAVARAVATGAGAGAGTVGEAGAGSVAEAGMGGAGPWWDRVAIDPRSAIDLLAYAGMLDVRGREEDALRIRRRVFGEGRAGRVADLDRLAREEVERLMVGARPWEALSVAAALPGSLVDELRPAVAAAIALREAVCAEGCASVESRRVVDRVLGEAWADEERPRLDSALRARDYGRPPADAVCPTLAELLAVDAAGDLAEHLRQAHEDLRDPELARRLAGDVEAELTMICAPALVASLLHAGGHGLTARNLDTRLLHVPEVDAARQLEGQASIAMAAGEYGRARLRLIAAAAASPHPSEVWRRAAIEARSYGQRELERQALRQLVLHAAGLDHPTARRALLLSSLEDAELAPNLEQPLAATAEAYARVVSHYLAEQPRQRRWGALEDLSRAVARRRWADERARERVDAALWAIAGTRERHPRPAAARATSNELALAAVDELRARAGEWIDSGGDAVDLEELIAAATTGDERERAAALAGLLARAKGQGPTVERELEQILLAGPTALAGEPVAMVADEQVLVRLIFRLDLAPGWIGG